MLQPAIAPSESSRASFRTHFNYIKCIEHLLSKAVLSASITNAPTVREDEIHRFRRLAKLTKASIEKDVELVHEDTEFALIAAPWLPVKCYYHLYYLESMLVHLIDGTSWGFSKGGHTGIRRKLSSLFQASTLSFTNNDLNQVHALADVQRIPRIRPGQNARHDYWSDPECPRSVARKLAEYKLRDAKASKGWNLRTRKGKAALAEFVNREKLMILDFFYWYRIKANYRDLDYIDFEYGVSKEEVLEYIQSYSKAYQHYRRQLSTVLNSLIAARHRATTNL
jgi:hypothetical protein